MSKRSKLWVSRKKRRVHPYDPNLSKKLEKKIERRLCLAVWIIIIASCLI